jgi:hypothetical protein
MTARMEARRDANNEKSEVLRSILISWMDIHKARKEAVKKKIKVKIDAHQGRMETTMNAWGNKMKAH